MVCPPGLKVRVPWLTLWGAIAQLLSMARLSSGYTMLSQAAWSKASTSSWSFSGYWSRISTDSRKVFVEVVQGPVVHIDGHTPLLQRACQPSIPVVGAIGPALVVLLGARRQCRGVEQDRRKALAMQRQGRHTIDGIEGFETREVEESRHDVSDMDELRADRPLSCIFAMR